ncbi:MAG: hypothetical protein Ct9H300mP29_8630 [Candidatus Neomarinimicrobiota bacterium]|nr:MAG: hypothetical protein Ct9H300mP29_8630 [Candidatus Neomarinimicrobiota bacterium]
MEGEDARYVQHVFNLQPDGNYKDEATGQFTGRNIFYLNKSTSELADKKKMSVFGRNFFMLVKNAFTP